MNRLITFILKMFSVYTAIKIDLHWHMCPYSATNVKPLQAIALVRAHHSSTWRHKRVRSRAFELSNVHTPSYFRALKGPYTNLNLYSKKTKIVHLLVTYIRKNPFELSEIHTRPYTNARTPSYFLRFQRCIHQTLFI